MLEQESDSAAIEQRCRLAASLLITRYKWQLLDLDTFASSAAQHLRTGVATDPQRAAMYTYSCALHTACSGVEGTWRQNVAYTELLNYLFSMASYRYPDVSEEAAQMALTHTFERFARCHDQGTFLAFALQQLADAARKLYQPKRVVTQSLATPTGNHGDTLGDLLPDERQQDPVETVLTEEQRERFEQLMIAFLQKHPRATQQIAALRLKYLEGLDDKTISQMLGKPIEKIYLLRHRAIAKLRADPDWRALAKELGLLLDEDDSGGQ